MGTPVLSFGGFVGPSGRVTNHVMPGVRAYSMFDIASMIQKHGAPQKGLPEEVNDWRAQNVRLLYAQSKKLQRALRKEQPFFFGSLYLTVFRHHSSDDPLWYGLASLRVVTTAGVNFLVDAFQGTVEPEILKYHGIGTGSTAENVADTDLDTELTTEYSSDNTRATGSLTEGASANIYRTVGTNTVDASVAIIEHGIFSVPTVGSGTLLDRSVFALAVNLVSGDSLQSTYDLTLAAGS